MPTDRDERHPPVRSVLLLLATLIASIAGTTTANAASFAYDAQLIARIDAHEMVAIERPALPSGAREASASSSVGERDTSTTPIAVVNATNFVDDVFRAPATSITRHGQLTNGTYTIDAAGMAPHTTGSLAGGRSQWWSSVDAERATLDAASYADANGLWVGPKAKVPVTNGTVGVLGRTGEPTEWINVYRNANGFIHGSPGGAG